MTPTIPLPISIPELLIEAHRLCGLKAFGGKRGRLSRRGTPALRIVRCPSQSIRWAECSRQTTGPGTIILYVWPGQTRYDLQVSLLHELTHLSNDGCWHHYTSFRKTFLEAAREAWNLDLDDLNAAQPHRHLDHAVTAALAYAQGGIWGSLLQWISGVRRWWARR